MPVSPSAAAWLESSAAARSASSGSPRVGRRQLVTRWYGSGPSGAPPVPASRSGRPGSGSGSGSGPGSPSMKPWPSVAPAARAVASCASESIPSASTVAWRRSASKPTAVTTRAMSLPSRSVSRRRSSLITSGYSSGISASERESAPMSSSEAPQPCVRSAVSERSTASGRSVSALSVISITSVAWFGGSSGTSRSSAPASALRNSANGAPNPAAAASRNAACRHARSTSANRPCARAVANSCSGDVPSRGRASASYPITAPSRRSKIGWNAACTSSPLATPARDPEGLLTDAFNPNATSCAAPYGQTCGQTGHLHRAGCQTGNLLVDHDDGLAGDGRRLVLRVLLRRAHERDLVGAVGRAGRELVDRHALQRPRAGDPAVERARLEPDREQLLAELHRVAVAGDQRRARGEDAAQARVHAVARAQDGVVDDHPVGAALELGRVVDLLAADADGPVELP